MTGAEPPPDGAATPVTTNTALLAQLMAVVRPEFRSDVLVPAADHPVLGSGGLCAVPGCERQRGSLGLCPAHRQRRRADGDPPLDEWLARPHPALRGKQVLPSCSAPGCRYGRQGRGLCTAHHRQWIRVGRPDVAGWLSSLPAVSTVQGQRDCALPQCQLWAVGQQRYCNAHDHRWRGQGQPDHDHFLTATRDFGEQRFDFRVLPRQLRLEMQYGLQRRVDDRAGRYRPRAIAPALKLAASLNVSSLLELDADQLHARLSGLPGMTTSVRAFFIYTHEQLQLLLRLQGWDGEYSRDRWDLHRLIRSDTQRVRYLHFDTISQPWLRDLAKRWCRWRLSTAGPASPSTSTPAGSRT